MTTENDDATFFRETFSRSPDHTPVSAEPAPTPPASETSPIQVTPAAEATQQSAQVALAEPDAPRMVPLAELIETRRRAQTAEDERRQYAQQAVQLAETIARLTQQPQAQQPQSAPIDPELDPAGAYREMEARTEQRFLNLRLDMSEQNARVKHGVEIVDRALAALDTQGPAFRQAFINQPDPYAALVDWHQGQTMRQTIGDPAKYEADLTARIRAQIIAEMRAGSPPPSNLPPSLSVATKASTAAPVIEDDGEFFKAMMKPKRL